MADARGHDPSGLLSGIEDDPDLSQTTKRHYREKLHTLSRLLGQPLDWLARRPAEVYAAVCRAYGSPQTRRAFLAAVRALFKRNETLRRDHPDQLDQYGEYHALVSQVTASRALNAEPSDRERSSWVPWADVLAKERHLAATEYASHDHLLLAMYCLIDPLRQDFGNVKILVDRLPPPDADRNFLAIAADGSWARLVLNRYKTAQHYAAFERDLPPALTAIVKASLLREPRRYLFETEAGRPYAKANSFTQFSNRALLRLFGRKVTVSTLRHSRISAIDFNAATPGQLISTANNMRHSMTMQQLYRRNVAPAPPPPSPPPGSAPLGSAPPGSAPPRPQPARPPALNVISYGPNGERFITLAV